MKTYINIDPNFKPFKGNELKFEMLQFSGGEMHIKLDNDSSHLAKDIDTVIITNRFRDGNDLMKVLIAKDALMRRDIKNFELVIPYMPYARQDRQCANGESFTLKVFTNLINSAKFDKVYVIDAHSDVAPALIDNCINISNEKYVIKAIENISSEVLLISPDSGANKKMNKLYEILTTRIPTNIAGLVKCDKVRDVRTGALSGFEVFAEDLEEKDCLIVDDICDGGRTFVGIADELKKKNPGNIYLFVTHGIFSKGLESLKIFKKIYTTNSFSDIKDINVKQFKLEL